MQKGLKENMVFIIVVILLVCFALLGIFTFMNKQHKGNTKAPKTEQTSQSINDSSSTTSAVETPDEKNYRKAKLKLERPYTAAPEEIKQVVVESFRIALASIHQAGNLSEVKSTYENHLSMTQEAMTQTFAMALLINNYTYQETKLEVTQSDNEDVVQFLVTLTKNGEENCYFVGNFNTSVQQIQLKAYIGGNIGGTFG
ncbi:TPA: hypothetical protein VJE30_001358 [Streptococcus pyogenes]|nr:hypothetical protein [Streptococcus pyogenes]